MDYPIVEFEGVAYYSKPWPGHAGARKLIRVVPKIKTVNPIKASKQASKKV